MNDIWDEIFGQNMCDDIIGWPQKRDHFKVKTESNEPRFLKQLNSWGNSRRRSNQSPKLLITKEMWRNAFKLQLETFLWEQLIWKNCSQFHQHFGVDLTLFSCHKKVET